MIYIILPVHNRINETKKFISCLKKQTYRYYHLVLVDDGCTDGTADSVARELPGATILRGNGNLWWAGSLEKARAYLEKDERINLEDIILIMNDDTTFDAGFLDNIVKDIVENPETVFIAQYHEQSSGDINYHGFVVDWKRFQFRKAIKDDEINVLSTRGLYMKYDVFRDIGRFHPVLLPHYGSDYEFTHRAFKKDIPLRVSERSILFGSRIKTGLHDVDYSMSFRDLLANLFISKRSVYNRIMWTNFVILSCVPKYIPINLLRVHIGTIKILGMWFLHQFRDRKIQFTLRLKRLLKKGIRIVVGAGGIKQKHWIVTDKSQIDVTERRSWLKFVAPDSVDAILAEHIWEHLTADEALMAAKNCREFLKPGGHIRIAVPDGYFPDTEYINQVKPLGLGSGSEDHKVLYTYKTLGGLYSSLGFDVRLLEYWDEKGIFHYSSWDPGDGMIQRSREFDPRNQKGELKYTSLILDAIKK